MLITKEQVLAAMELKPVTIQNAFHRNGYDSEMVREATYKGMTSNGSFVYIISYNGDDGVEDGMCYVYYDDFVKLLADY